MTAVSVIIPILNEATRIAAALTSLRDILPSDWEILIVDGGSEDGSIEAVEGLCSQLLHSEAGRGRQMNAGARQASGSYLLFLHIDSQLVDACVQQLEAAILPGEEAGRIENSAAVPQWGWFDLRLDNPRLIFSAIAFFINYRSRLSRICTGDQTLWVRAETFWQLGGFPDQPLMEDIELSARLRRSAKPRVLPGPVTTAARRWEKHGLVRTVLLMWQLRFLYWWGVAPEVLAERYYGRQHKALAAGTRLDSSATARLVDK